MTVDNLLAEFKNTKTFSAESINHIKDDAEIRKLLIQYFKKNKNRDFALHLLERTTEIRNLPYPDGYDMGIDTLMLSSYILGLHQNIEDCLKIWEAKTIDFDTFCGHDIELVLFAGLEETITYLKKNKSEEAESALEYIEECRETSDFKNLTDYFSESNMPWFV
jgi:hypothetical protein